MPSWTFGLVWIHSFCQFSLEVADKAKKRTNDCTPPVGFPDNYVHRLVASKTDGKMVQYECEGDLCQAEKIDALQLEVRRHGGVAASLLCRRLTLRCSDVSPAVLVPADQSAGVPEDLLGEQDRPPGEGNG